MKPTDISSHELLVAQPQLEDPQVPRGSQPRHRPDSLHDRAIDRVVRTQKLREENAGTEEELRAHLTEELGGRWSSDRADARHE